MRIIELETFIMDVLRTEYSAEESKRMTEIILFGELAGKPSHGIIRLVRGNYGAFVEGKRGTMVYNRKTKVSTQIDGKGNPGMLIASIAMQEVLKLAKDNGIGIVGTKGSFGSAGALTYYCEKIARENLIPVMLAQSVPVIAPFNTKRALFGTNPIAFAIPTENDPLIFDMSTSAIAFGNIMKHKATNTKLPEGVAIDEEGNMTTDPHKAVNGATLAFDASYKGSGLAMMVELLAGLWTESSYEGLHEENGAGNLFLAFSPELLSDTESLKQKAKEFIETLRNAPTRDGKKVRIPGENTLKIRDANLAKGEIEVNETILNQIKSA